MGTLAIGSLCYYLVGWGLAYGSDLDGEAGSEIIGFGDFAVSGTDNSGKHNFFFQLVFAATGATIVSGALAGRVQLRGYFVIVCFMTAWIYPVVSRWIWATGGWLSAFTDAPDRLFAPSCGMLDYAGSGVVHMSGGVAAFVAAAVLGPRIGRFEGTPMEPHNMTLCTLGVLILWMGWYGFNCGSTLAFDGGNASKVAVTTTLSPAAACVTAMLYSLFIKNHFDLQLALNAILAGLVSITAGCAVVPDGYSVLIGFLGAFIYIGASNLMVYMKIDDPLDAIAIHGVCGMWGCLAAGLFASQQDVENSYGCDLESSGGIGTQFQVQIVGVLAIVGWVVVNTLFVVVPLRLMGWLRVDHEDELMGLDASEHGGAAAYTFDSEKRQALDAEVAPGV